VTAAGGALSLDSEPEVGTAITAHFPRAEATADSLSSAATGHAVAGGETVLVVEDEPSMRRMAERILRHAGYEVICSPSGQDALRRLAETRGEIDLLLSDVIMPEMSGTELASRVAVLYPKTRILLMSGFTDRPEVAPVEEGVALLEKPFRAEVLLARARAVLDADRPTKD
jgi:DNA-binding response OmpR family regulator